MIAFLNGVVAGKTAQTVYLDVSGVGFAVSMSQTSLAKLPAIGGEARVLTYLQTSESGMALYGFLTEEEKALFERLIGVSGVGPKAALAALSTFSPQALVEAIAVQDVSLIQKIPGVGKKTASRIILELKGSFDEGFESLFAAAQEEKPVVDARLAAAVEALLSMGFSSVEADLALKDAPEGATEGALVKYALKRLSPC